MGDFDASGRRGLRSRAIVRGYTSVRGLGVDRAGALIEGREDLSGSPVLIRVLSPALAADHGFARNLRHTVDRLRDVRHASLAAVITFDQQSSAVVEELVDGVSLRHLLEVQGALEINAAVALFDDCLAALEVLHDLHVCHLDVRPESVIVSVAGVVVLRDAGIPVPALHPGWRSGTPQYMAPELWAGRVQTPATDLYAATAVFFEALTGWPPYPGSDLSALGYGHQRGAIPVGSAPPLAGPLLTAGLAKDPRDRPVTAGHMRRDLDLAARSYLGDGWRDNGRSWLAGAAAARADDRLPTLPPPDPHEPDDEDLAFLPMAAVSGSREGLSRGWRVWAGVAAAVAALLAVVVVAAHALSGPADTPVTTPPGQPVFASTPPATPMPSQVLVTSTPGETAAGTATPTAAPTRTPIPTSTGTIDASPGGSPTPTPTPTPTPKPKPTPTPTCFLICTPSP